MGLKLITEKQRATNRNSGKKGTKTVLQYDLQGNFIKEWTSATEAGKQLKINFKNISACCNGKRKTAGGYIWKFRKEVA